MIRRPPVSTPTDTLVPSTTRFRSLPHDRLHLRHLSPQGRGARAARERGSIAPRRRGDRPRHMGLRPIDRNAELVRPVQVDVRRSEEHTSELQSLMRISYAVFCLKKKNHNKETTSNSTNTNSR